MLEMKHIEKVFGRGTVNESRLFRDFSLSVSDGEFLSVVGSNGSGKTTMLNIVSGTVPCDGGEILLGGRNITRQPEHRRASRIGRVFQNPALGTVPGMTIIENLALAANKGRPYSLGFMIEHRRRNELRERLSVLGLGLEDKPDIPVGLLSGGQRQALSLLMSTMTEIDLLLLDEHTAALDPKTAAKVLSLSEKIIAEEGLTAMMVTHNMKDAIAYGNRLIMMNAGKIIFDVSGEDKRKLTVEDLLDAFSKLGGTEFANDRALLG